MASEIIDSLMWRYATKKFNPEKKISDGEFSELLEIARLSPSSFGLQAWKFIVVKDEELRKKLREAGLNQPQITDASHLVVLCAKNDVKEDDVKRYLEDISKKRNVPIEGLKGFEDMIKGSLTNAPPEYIPHWNKRQVYIALGFLLFGCAIKKIDACPMEGFNSEKFDGILGLKEKGLSSVVLCAIGHRAEDDSLSNMAKVRFSKDEVFEFR